MGTCLDFQRCDCKPTNKFLSPGTSVKKGLLYPGEVVNLASTAGPLHGDRDNKHLPCSTCQCLPAPPTKQGLPSCLFLEQLQAASLPSQGRRESWGRGVPHACPLVGEMRNDDPRRTVIHWSLEVEPCPLPSLCNLGCPAFSVKELTYVVLRAADPLVFPLLPCRENGTFRNLNKYWTVLKINDF